MTWLATISTSLRFVNDFLFASKKEKVLTSDQRDWIGMVLEEKTYKLQDLSSRLDLKYDQVKKIGRRHDSKHGFHNTLYAVALALKSKAFKDLKILETRTQPKLT